MKKRHFKNKSKAVKKISKKAKNENIDYSDIPSLDADFFAKAQIRLPEKKATVTMRLDSDILRWFKTQGKGYQTRINAILRSYMQAQLN